MANFTRRFALISDGVVEASTIKTRVRNPVSTPVVGGTGTDSSDPAPYATSTDSQGAIKAQPAEAPQRPNALTLGYKETFVDFQSAPANSIQEFVAYRDHVLPPGGVLTISLGGNVDPLSGGKDVEIARGRNRSNDASGTIRIIASGQSTSGARMTFRANPKFNYDPEGYLPEGVDQVEMSSRSLGAYQFKQRPTVFSKTVCLRQIQQAKAYHTQMLQSPALPPQPMTESNYNFALNDESPLEPAPINGHVNNPRLINLSNGYLLSMWLEGVEIQPNFLINFTDRKQSSAEDLYWTNGFSNSRTDGNICFSVCSPKTRQWSRPVRLANVCRSKTQGGPSNWGFTMASSNPDAAAANGAPYIQSFDVAEDADSKVVFLSVLYSRGIVNPSEIEIWSSPLSDLIFDTDSPILRPEITHAFDTAYSYSKTLPFKRKSSFMIGKDAALSTEEAEAYTVDYPDPISGLDVASQGSCVSIACEFLTSGRLMMALSTQEKLFSLVSDDLGVSFAATEVLDLLFQDDPFTPQMNKSRWIGTVRQFHTHLTIRNLDGGETALLLCASAFNSRMPLAEGGIRADINPGGEAAPAYLQADPSDGKEGMSIISLWVTSDGASFSHEIPLGRNELHWAQGCEVGLFCEPVPKTASETSWYIPSPTPDPDPVDNLAGDRGYGMRILNQVSAWEADIVQRDDGYIQVYIASANVGGPHFQFTKNMFAPPDDNPEENPFPVVGDVRFTQSWGYGGWGYKQATGRWDTTLNPPQLRVGDRGEQTNSFDTTACNQLFTRTLRLQSLTTGTTEAPLLTNMTPLMGLQTGGDKLRPSSPQNTIRSKRGAWATNWMPCNTLGQTEQNTTPLGGGVDFDNSIFTDLPGFFTVGSRPFGYRDGYYRSFTEGDSVPQPNVASGGENPPVPASQFVAYPTFANGVTGVSAVRFRGEVVVATAINQITFRHATLPIFEYAPTPWNLKSGATQSEIAAIREGSLRIQSTSYWQPISENIGTMSCNSICGPNDMFQDMNAGFITTIDPLPPNLPPYSLAAAVLSNFRYANQSLRFTRATANSIQLTNIINKDSSYIYAPNLGPGDPFLAISPANTDVPPIVGSFIGSQLRFLLSGQYLGKFYHDCWDCWGRPDQQGWLDTFSWENPSRGLVPWTHNEWSALFGGGTSWGAGLVMYDAFTEPAVGLYGGPSIQKDTNKYYPAGMLQGSHGGFMEITGARNFVKSGSLCYDKHEEATQVPRGFGLPTNVPEPEYNFALPNYMGAQSSMTSWQGDLDWDSSSQKWSSDNTPRGSGLECNIRMVVAVVDGGAKNIGGTLPEFSESNPCSTTDGINCDVQLIGIGGMTDLVDPQGWSNAFQGPVGWVHSGPVSREDGSRVRFQVSVCRKPQAAIIGDHPSKDIYVQVADLGPGGPANPLIIGSIKLEDDPLSNGVRDEMRFDKRQAGRPSPGGGEPWLTANRTPRKYLNYPRFVEILVSTIEYNPRELQSGSSGAEFRTYIKCVARVLDQVEDPDSVAPFLPVTWQNLPPGYPGSFPPDMPIGIPGSDYLQLFSTPTNLNNESALEFVKWGHDTGTSGVDPSDDWGTINVSRWKSFHFSRPDTFRVPKESFEYTKYANAQPGSDNDQFTNVTKTYQRFNNKGLQTYPWRLMNTTQVQSQSDDYILRDVYGSERAGFGINVSEIPIPGNRQIDTGLLTPLGPAQINPLGPNYLESGMVVDLKGSYLQSGNYGYSIKGESPAENVKDSPIVNSWISRSGSEEYVMGASRTILKNASIDYPDIGQTWARSKAALCPDIEVFFDAGEDPGAIFNEATKNQVLPGDAGVFGRAGAFRGFRPEAFALLGHNSPGYKIEFFQENPYPTEPTAGATPGNIAGGGKPVLQMYFILGGDPILGGQYNVDPTYLNPTTGDKRALDPKIIRRYMHSYWIPYDKFTDPESGQQRWHPNPKGMGVSIGANAITLRPAWWGDRPENQPGPGGVPELEGGAENWANDPTSKPQQRASLIPWRPHQFKSQESGPKYYCCIFSQDYNLGQGVPVDETPYSHQGSSGEIVQDWDVEEHLGIYNRIVFRIKDNSATTLFFDAPISKYFQSTSTMPMSEMPDGFSQMGRQISGIAIYSDRQMASLDRVSWSLGEMHAGPAGIFPGWSLPRSVPEYVGCRYAKLTLFGCYRADKDEQETRIGRMMTGFMANLSCPDFEWGWSRGVTSGNTITTFANGARVSRRNHSPRRSFSVSYGTSQSAEDPLWLQVNNDITPSVFGAFDNKPIQQNLVFEAYGLTPNRGFGTMPIGPEFSGRNADLNGDPIPDVGAFSKNIVLIAPVLDRLRLPSDIPNSSRAPDGNPFTDGSWLVSSGAGAEWNNKEGQIATWDGNSWVFDTPLVGSLLYVKGQDRYGLCTQTIGGETPQGPIIWLHAWQYSAVEWYQQNKKSWQEILDLFQSVEIDGRPILLAFEGDLVPTESATKGNVLDIHSFWYRGTRVAYDPCTIMMARVKSISSLTQKGYLGGSIQTSDGKECRPRPLLTTSSITFEEDF